MINISEFERGKPQKTYKFIEALIKKYQSAAAEDIMEEADEAKRSLSLEIKNDLLRLKQIFLSGE